MTRLQDRAEKLREYAWDEPSDELDQAIRRSERRCWLCGAKQEHAGIEPDESWDWSETRPDTDDDGPVCPRCTEENQ